MRLISATNVSLTHTVPVSKGVNTRPDILTLFPNERVVAVVGVVCISCRRATAISEHAKVELCYTVRPHSYSLNLDIPDLGTHDRIGLGDPSYGDISIEHVLEEEQRRTSISDKMARWYSL